MKKLLIALGVIIVVLAAAVAAVEIGGRPVTQNYIRDQLIKALPGTDPTVEIGPGSLILQAIDGHLDTVDATIPDATIGNFTSDLAIRATDVPLDQSAPLGTVRIGVTVAQDQVQDLVRGIDGLEAASVTIDDDVSIDSTFSILALKVPYGFDVAPSADKGELLLTPTSVSINKAEVSLADLAKVPFGSAITDLVKPQHVCVAGYLPKVLTLSDAGVSGSNLELTLQARGIALGSTDFTALGSCE